MPTPPVPSWLTKFVQHWAKALFLDDLIIRIVPCPSGDPDCAAVCYQRPDRNDSVIEFRVDIEDNDEWRQYALHELIHAAHQRVDHAVEKAILRSLPKNTRKLANAVYRQQVESFTERMSKSLMQFGKAKK